MKDKFKQVFVSLLTACGLLAVVMLTVKAAQKPEFPINQHSTKSRSVEFNDWLDECIDCRETNSTASYVSLAVDPNSGFVHASYSSLYAPASSSYLYYGIRDDSGWHTQTVDYVGSGVRYTSIALDSNGFPHIGYAKQICAPFASCEHSLHYAYLDVTGWHTTTVDNNGDVGSYLSLALDANDLPHLSYTDGTNGNVKYAHFEMGNWQIETVASAVGSFAHTSIDVDSNNDAHISYLDSNNYDLMYAYLNVSGWHTETVDSNGVVGWNNSLVLDDNDNPHIGYQDGTNGSLKYAYLENTTWLSETIASDLNWEGTRPSLALDSNDLPHIGFSSVFDCNMFSCQFNLHYIHFDGAVWEMETLIDSHSAGSHMSLALNADDYPHIGYFDDTYKETRHIYGTILTKPDSIEIDGPASSLKDMPVSFTASVEPISSTTPLTYVWEATDQMPITQTNGLTDSIEFTWALTGMKTITVTAVNPGGSISATHTITISAGYTLYLPTIIKP